MAERDERLIRVERFGRMVMLLQRTVQENSIREEQSVRYVVPGICIVHGNGERFTVTLVHNDNFVTQFAFSYGSVEICFGMLEMMTGFFSTREHRSVDQPHGRQTLHREEETLIDVLIPREWFENSTAPC